MSVRDLFRRREAAQETAAEAEDVLLKALLNDEEITREKALTLPAVSSAADFICGAIASMPVRLYRRRDGKVETLEDDPRVRFLNGDTGDTLDACQMKRAAVEDYLLDGGGYIYIRRRGNEVTGLFYVRGSDVSVQKNDDPIFKDYLLSVGGKNYQPWDFIKLLRNTRDGASGTGLTEEVGKALETAYRMLLYQLGIARRGGGKRGFLKSQNRLTPEAIEALKKAWREMYEEKTENVIVLNNGLEFQEAAESSTEMQLNQSKNALTGEFNALFHIYPADFERTFKEAIYPIVRAFETALDRDLLLESEKESCFFEFDFKEIVKVSIKDRYQAYKLAKETGFMTINEIRRAENLEYVEGMDVVNVGLSAVLFDTVNHVFFTPNTGTVSDLDDVQNAGEEPAAGQPSAVSGQPSAVQPSAVSGQPSAGTGQSAAVEGVLPAPVKAEPKRPAEKRPGADQKKPVPAKETAKREDGADAAETQRDDAEIQQDAAKTQQDADEPQPEFAETQPEFTEAQPDLDETQPVAGEALPESEEKKETEAEPEAGADPVLTSEFHDDTMGTNQRYNPYRGKDGRFATGPKKTKKSKYKPSPRRDPHGITTGPKHYARLCSILNKEHPNAEKGQKFVLNDPNVRYHVTADGNGGLRIDKATKIK